MRLLKRLVILIAALTVIAYGISAFGFGPLARRLNSLRPQSECNASTPQWASSRLEDPLASPPTWAEPGAVWNERFCPTLASEPVGSSFTAESLNLATGLAANRSQVAKLQDAWRIQSVKSPIVDTVNDDMDRLFGGRVGEPFVISLQEAKLEIARDIAAGLAQSTLTNVQLFYGFALSPDLGEAKAGTKPGESTAAGRNMYCCHSGVAILTNGEVDPALQWGQFYSDSGLAALVGSSNATDTGLPRMVIGCEVKFGGTPVDVVAFQLNNIGTSSAKAPPRAIPPTARHAARTALARDVLRKIRPDVPRIAIGDWNEKWGSLQPSLLANSPNLGPPISNAWTGPTGASQPTYMYAVTVGLTSVRLGQPLTRDLGTIANWQQHGFTFDHPRLAQRWSP